MDSGGRTGRIELLRLRQRLALVKKGIDILTGKRDALLLEFSGVAKEAKDARETLNTALLIAEAKLAEARATERMDHLTATGLAARRKISFDVTVKNVWGVKIPSIGPVDVKRGVFERGFAPGGRSPAVAEAAGRFEDVTESLIRAAVVESRLRAIGGAIKNATRRINALEKKLAPEIRHKIDTIMARLEEKAREDTFRLKRYKSIRETRDASFVIIGEEPGRPVDMVQDENQRQR